MNIRDNKYKLTVLTKDKQRWNEYKTYRKQTEKEKYFIKALDEST